MPLNVIPARLLTITHLKSKLNPPGNDDFKVFACHRRSREQESVVMVSRVRYEVTMESAGVDLGSCHICWIGQKYFYYTISPWYIAVQIKKKDNPNSIRTTRRKHRYPEKLARIAIEINDHEILNVFYIERLVFVLLVLLLGEIRTYIHRFSSI